MLEGIFWFNGRCSSEFDLKIGYINPDSFPFGIQRENIIETIPHTYKTYSLGSSYEPLKKSFIIYTSQILNTKKRIEICDWLFVDKFCELYSQCQPDIIYYCKLEGDTQKFLACNGGYIECEMICNTPFPLTRPRITERSFDPQFIKDGIFTSTFDIRNDSNYKSWGDFIVKLRIPSEDVLKKALNLGESGALPSLSIRIWNKTNSSSSDAFVISSELNPRMPLKTGEILSIDMNNHIIHTNARIGTGDTYKHRLENSNLKFLTLNKGLNEIEITGFCDCQITTQFPVLH